LYETQYKKHKNKADDEMPFPPSAHNKLQLKLHNGLVLADSSCGLGHGHTRKIREWIQPMLFIGNILGIFCRNSQMEGIRFIPVEMH